MNSFKKILTPLILIVSLVGIIAWQFQFKKVNFYVVCAAMLVLSMLPFFIRFERKKITAAELSLIATLIALAVASRAVFYLFPQVKPIGAVVIIAAVCLGAEKGYIIGAFSMFVSNFIFGQGIWTPFQMAALGAVGLISGLLFSADKMKEGMLNRVMLSLTGFILTFAVYGAIVDMSTVLFLSGTEPTFAGLLAVYAAGIPTSLAFGITTAVFLFLFGEPFIRKINRVITKYGMK